VADLISSHCQRLNKTTSPLTEDELAALLNEVAGWQLDNQKKSISRCFRFDDYYQTLAFVNASAWISHQQDHHPDLEVSYNRCNVIFSTHSIGGLSRNDFICAAKFNALLSEVTTSK